MKKTLLLSGATGFIGQNIFKAIKSKYENDYEIVLLSSCVNADYTTVLHKNYTFSKKDFWEQGINSIDIVLHIGAFTPKSATEANDIDKSNTNIYNTKYLLDNMPNIPKKVIFLSTLDVYGKIAIKIDESCTTNPLSMYGWSKLYCEKMIENWATEHKIIIQILRIGHIYGKGEEAYKKVIPLTIQKIKNGENPQIFGTGEEKRSFLHIDDVCELILKSIALEQYEGAINLCSSKSYSINEVVKILIEISKSNLQIEYKETEVKGIDFVFDTSKMNSLLGYEKINIKDGLENEYN